MYYAWIRYCMREMTYAAIVCTKRRLKTFKALNGLLCADVPLRNYSLTHETTSWPSTWKYDVISEIRLRQSMRIHSRNSRAKFNPQRLNVYHGGKNLRPCLHCHWRVVFFCLGVSHVMTAPWRVWRWHDVMTSSITTPACSRHHLRSWLFFTL